MRLAATLLVRDEADVIEANLRYHLALGVDVVIATDHGSVDGTAELLEGFAAEGLVDLRRRAREEKYTQASWVTEMARDAARLHGADWVVNLDADEFWAPRSGTLRDVFAAVPQPYGALAAPLLNVLPAPEGSEPFWRRMTVVDVAGREGKGLLEHGLEKVAHRAGPNIKVARGNHAVRGARLMPGWSPAVVLHYPIRSLAQVEHKMELAGHLLPKKRRGLAEAHREGRLADVFASLVPAPEAIAERVARGRLCITHQVESVLDGDVPGAAAGDAVALDARRALASAGRR